MNDQDILGLVLLAIGGWLIGAVCWVAWRQKRAQRWPTVAGRICESRVRGAWQHDGGESRYMYTTDISYEYEVGGHRYVGNQVFAVESWSSREADAQQAAEAYPSGKPVVVSVNPERPTESMLASAQFSTPFLALWLGAGLLLLAIGTWLLMSPR